MEKRFLYAFLLCLLLTSCFGRTSNMGDSVSISKLKPFYEPTPFGMEYVPRGSFVLSTADEVGGESTPTKRVTMEAFWIDNTEITNDEYRQYVYWVRDSIARQLLSDEYPQFLITEDPKTKEPLEQAKLNWKLKIDYNNQDFEEALSSMYYSGDDIIKKNKTLDPRRLIYTYRWIDYKQAAKSQNSYDYTTNSYNGFVVDANGDTIPIVNRSSFVFSEATPVYPDTLVWIRDFTYAYNDPFTNLYFAHRAYNDYPLVGVTWKQAKAFCHWRTQLYNKEQEKRELDIVHDYRLPTEAEWEYAARANKDQNLYPWGSYYTSSHIGCYMANFKPRRGNYIPDTFDGTKTAQVASYGPNDFNLFDMAGNVAEWTTTAFDESTYEYTADFNPDFQYNALPNDPPVMKRKVIRGGSWKDVSYFIRNGTRSYEYQDSTKSFIGFRCVKSSFMDEFKKHTVNRGRVEF